MTARAASHNTVNSLIYKYVSFTYYGHYSCIFRASCWSCIFRSSFFQSSISTFWPQIWSSIFRSRIFSAPLVFYPPLWNCKNNTRRCCCAIGAYSSKTWLIYTKNDKWIYSTLFVEWWTAAKTTNSRQVVITVGTKRPTRITTNSSRSKLP